MITKGGGFRESVQQARERWQQGRETLRTIHEDGAPGRRVVNAMSDLLDHVLLCLYKDGLADHSDGFEANISLVLHGGCGRREVAPYSDVDLMLLYQGAQTEELSQFARRINQDITDTGLQLGFSLRTPRDACSMSLKDPAIFSSLTESRFLGGNVELYENYLNRLKRLANRRSLALIKGIVAAREKERVQFGETVYLLRPNIKKSLGALRDIHLMRWIGFVRFGETDIDQLCRRRALISGDATRLHASGEFLLRLRNELHWSAGRANDGLGRNEQVRIAEKFGYEGNEGVLSVEKMMQDYFRFTSQIRDICNNFVTKNLNRRSFTSNVLAPLVTRQIDDSFLMGPTHIGVHESHLNEVKGDLTELLRLMQLACVHGKDIDYDTWDSIRQAMTESTDLAVTRQVAEQFMALLANTTRLSSLLKQLHEMRVLAKILPDFKHARGLLQFNEYHKFTVDEHSLEAIRIVTSFEHQQTPAGKAYRAVQDKNILHLALLLHDLGKGYPEDHSEVGRRIAEKMGKRLFLKNEDTEAIKFLVHNHLVMTHLAFHRDINDESMVAEFAANVGSVQMLTMLYVLTCADVEAVGPGVMTAWKFELLTGLYRTAKNILTGNLSDDQNFPGSPAFYEKISSSFEDEETARWIDSAARNLPRNYCLEHDPEFIGEQLGSLRETVAGDVQCWIQPVRGTKLIELCIGKREKIRSGVFYKTMGMLASLGVVIRSTDIKPIGRSLIWYWVKFEDRDFEDPPQSRLDAIREQVVQLIEEDDAGPPTFRTKWHKRGGGRALQLSRPQIEVKIDNQTVDSVTIIDVFAYKKIGLLYKISKKIHQLGLDVNYARVSTYAHQLIAVFYVVDGKGNKVRNRNQLQVIKKEVLTATKNFLDPS